MSLRFQADADLKYTIVKAVRRREPSIDFASADDSDLGDIDDSEVLERAAQEDRILVSHDRRTMIAHIRARMELEKSSPGLFVVSQGVPVLQVADAIVLVWAVSEPSDWRDQVHYLPDLSRHLFSR